MTITQIKLHTPVLQCGTVNPCLTAETDSTEESGLYEHVLRLLEEQVIRTIEVTAELYDLIQNMLGVDLRKV
jgi:hypothetical protein